ncbi:metallophosphoesterase [Noviherbaspirillum denitrificans]|nr:metallophosphoesterase [Noviherbaspirillum denitrificans]
MPERMLPPGLVMWPAGTARKNRLCVLISDIHCTDCTVGNQTASETDWQLFFEQMEFAVGNPGDRAQAPADRRIDELLLILNGDIVDLIRTSKWAAAGVYPWQRDDPRFADIVVATMRDIVDIHAKKRPQDSEQPYSGFFYWMRESLDRLRKDGIAVTVVPIVGNHDKELQVVPAARQMFYEECLGIDALSISDAYRAWVAAQMGTSEADMYPHMPFYFADTGLRLLATHGQWRDQDNARATARWKLSHGWQPQAWKEEQYRAFSDPCFGDTVASGMLSRFIWKMASSIDRQMQGANRICNLLDEMDLYRPSVGAVVRLLHESWRMAIRTPEARGLHNEVLRCFRESLVGWISHDETWNSASLSRKFGLCVLKVLSKIKWYPLEITLMRMMAKMQEPESDIKESTLAGLPAFQPAYRMLGLRLHVEGHTHVALEADMQFQQPREGRNNYTYINLGAWRDAIVQKRNRGYRRRGVGRALFIFDLARQTPHVPDDAYRFYARDMTSWGDRMDSW